MSAVAVVPMPSVVVPSQPMDPLPFWLPPRSVEALDFALSCSYVDDAGRVRPLKARELRVMVALIVQARNHDGSSVDFGEEFLAPYSQVRQFLSARKAPLGAVPNRGASEVRSPSPDLALKADSLKDSLQFLQAHDILDLERDHAAAPWRVCFHMGDLDRPVRKPRFEYARQIVVQALTEHTLKPSPFAVLARLAYRADQYGLLSALYGQQDYEDMMNMTRRTIINAQQELGRKHGLAHFHVDMEDWTTMWTIRLCEPGLAESGVERLAGTTHVRLDPSWKQAVQG